MVQYGSRYGVSSLLPVKDDRLTRIRPLSRPASCMTGTLFLVSTPIGNLEDITMRALRVLREVTLIAAEDTRRTAKLLHHYQIDTPTTSFHAHNERGKAPALLEKLAAGQHIALVSDAGTPVLSDPGQELVRLAVAQGIRVEALPGASAILTAIATSGMGADGFTFLGFPPPKSNARKQWFAAVAQDPRPLVLFEAPHRLARTLEDAIDILGESRPIVAARELTKLHEEQIRGTLSSLRDHFRTHEPRGEFTLVIAPAPPSNSSIASDVPLDESEIWAEFCRLTNKGAERRAAINELARATGRSSRDIYSMVERAKARA